ncbi:hypothetical protein DM01DRAFT_1330817 [Hesseltinella vesiculosa]|uniref:BCD1 alpha/beta domain-containing protein n=1 Tax=Hesseltinella vesiculosa TaxID=101127 RepID=A0A1X2GXE2_9FUNG|nr:hypothetical protein DM01DRAFT_1330817 [Hesseltinella vesiculosa]
MAVDYVYLEDVARQSDNITRHRMKEYKAPKANQFKAKALMRQAKQLGIVYQMLPVGMSRHTANRTNYNTKLKEMFWSIEFSFPNCKNKRILDHGNLGSRTLRQVLDNLLMTETPHGRQDYATIRHELKPYIDSGMEQWTIALKQDRRRINITPCLDRTMNECLQYETVIEYPTIVLWFQEPPPLTDKVQDIVVDQPEENEDASSGSSDSSSDQDDNGHGGQDQEEDE